jgi:hypothetical protein
MKVSFQVLKAAFLQILQVFWGVMPAVSTGLPSPTGRNFVRFLSNPERLGHAC